MKQQTKGTILLLLTAFIWGSAFVAQKTGMEYIGPFTFNGIRSFIGALVLLPVIIFMVKRARAALADQTSSQADPAVAQANAPDPNALSDSRSKKNLLIGGICCGVAMFSASSLQQMGMVYTSSGKAGFITALYIIILPLLGMLIGKKVRKILWLCVGLAIVGLYLLTMSGSLSINRGDLLITACAFVFAVHILIIDYFSPRTNSVALSAVQLFVTGVLSVPCIAIFEDIDRSAVLDCWLPILYAGVMSCGIAYTLQIVAQKYTDPTVASLLLSLESVFAVITGMVILGEMMSGRELAGCIIMFCAIILAQLPEKKRDL